MYEKLDGQLYKQFISYGIKNIKLHKDIINDLNVFPVPDGDTGTNMTMTLTNGYNAIRDNDGPLSELAAKFAYAVSFGARGNSGVISSQFFKGFSECFTETDDADTELFLKALDAGVQYAYKSVSKPTEGTMLTVVREATEYVMGIRRERGRFKSIQELIDAFLDKARISLENTPELLPVLKASGVVDSGGAGIVYFFKGIKKYMNGEEIEDIETEDNTVKVIDYSVFNRKSEFVYGYCTELLIQLTDGKVQFDYDKFKARVCEMGDSVATSYEDEKVKLHVHTSSPEEILSYCHKFGEFLTLKIENMSVQHADTHHFEEAETMQEHRYFGVVATASDKLLEQHFKDMGVTATVYGGQTCNPSVQDFLSVFEKINADNIIVFPNNKNVILTANQAKKMYVESNIIVVNTKSMAECYSALGLIDYDSEDLETITDVIQQSINNTVAVSIAKAIRNTTYDEFQITTDDYVAVDDKKIIAVGSDACQVANEVIDKLLTDGNKDVVTIFAGKAMADNEVEGIESYIYENHLYVDCGIIRTDDVVYDLILSFE
ncbi:MAG: DAK2 domain-containing protein [Lachnospiraceae bacterium]|nr:DAK2 domain-containing protein [Lachnospiraceae bacterium]